MNMRSKYNLDDIAFEIGRYCVKWGRISVTQTKEKYGTVRVYCHFGISLHSFIFPNYCYKHRYFPKWLWDLDIDYFSKFFNFFNFIIIPYQHFIYKRAYWKYLYKYPHLFEEITSCADFIEILGFYVPRLCTNCSTDYKHSYWASKDNCDFCKESKNEGIK